MTHGKNRHLFRLALTTTLVLLAGCVYYNTFHNARKAFNEAEKARKSMRYRGGRINQAKYKTAIEKSLKVTENYPNSKWYDDALYVLAVSYYYTQQYSRAERRFRELLANYADSKYAKESELYLAKSKLDLNDVKEAMEIFEGIFNSDFERTYKAEAAMALGQYHYDDKDYSKAQSYFLAVRDSLGSQQEKRVAQHFIADGYYHLFGFKDALSAYLQVLGMDPSKDEKYHALYQAALCSFRLHRIADGMDYLQTLIDDEIYYDSLGVLKLRLAEGYEFDEDIAQAEAVYREVAEQERKRTVASEAYYRLALIYQYDYDDLAEAKKLYDKTVELGRSSEFGRDALERSSDIGKLEAFARTITIDSTTTQQAVDEAAHTQYQLAELYWFKLNKPDTAMAEMHYLVDSFPTAFETPKAMIALSEMYRDHSADSVTADSLLKELLVKYPHSDYVPEALEVLGLKGSEADTAYAELYLRKAEAFLADEGEVDSARAYYQYIVDHFPDSKYYLQARFSLIWLTETYDSPGDSSVYYAYSELIDSFPNTFWAMEASKRVSYQPTKRRQTEGQPDTSAIRDDTRDDESFTGDEGVEEDTSTYVDPMEAIYIGPDGDKITLLPLEPVETREEFIYPTEAYRYAWEGDLYFQVFLDFSGEVIDHIMKTRSPSEDINREASEAVASMIFDPLRIPPELQGSWFVYKFKIRKPDHLR